VRRSRNFGTPLDSWWRLNDPMLVTVVQRAWTKISILPLPLRVSARRERQQQRRARNFCRQLIWRLRAQLAPSVASPLGSVANSFSRYSRDQREYTVGAAASWEIDLSGWAAPRHVAAAAELQAAQADQVGTRITVAAEAADAYLQVREFSGTGFGGAAIIDTDTHLLEFVEVRDGLGVADDREVAQAEALSSKPGRRCPPLRVALEAQLNRLDVLMGAQRERTPKSFQASAIPGIPAITGAGPNPWMSCVAEPDIIAASAGLPRRTSESVLRFRTTTRRFRFPARLVFDSTARHSF